LKPILGELVFVGGCATALLISQLPGPSGWAMAGGSNGYEAALVRRQLTPVLISSFSDVNMWTPTIPRRT